MTIKNSDQVHHEHDSHHGHRPHHIPPEYAVDDIRQREVRLSHENHELKTQNYDLDHSVKMYKVEQEMMEEQVEMLRSKLEYRKLEVEQLNYKFDRETYDQIIQYNGQLRHELNIADENIKKRDMEIQRLKREIVQLSPLKEQNTEYFRRQQQMYETMKKNDNEIFELLISMAMNRDFHRDNRLLHIHDRQYHMQRMIDHKDMTLVLKEKELSRLKDNVLKYHMPVELSYFHYTIDDRNLQKSLELPNKLDRIITTEMKNTGCKIEVCKDHLRPNPLREENWALKKEIVELQNEIMYLQTYGAINKEKIIVKHHHNEGDKYNAEEFRVVGFQHALTGNWMDATWGVVNRYPDMVTHSVSNYEGSFIKVDTGYLTGGMLVQKQKINLENVLLDQKLIFKPKKDHHHHNDHHHQNDHHRSHENNEFRVVGFHQGLTDNWLDASWDVVNRHPDLVNHSVSSYEGSFIKVDTGYLTGGCNVQKQKINCENACLDQKLIYRKKHDVRFNDTHTPGGHTTGRPSNFGSTFNLEEVSQANTTHLPQGAVVEELRRLLKDKQSEIDENLKELLRLRTVVPDRQLTTRYNALATRVSQFDIGDFGYEEDAEVKLDNVQKKYDALKSKCDDLVRKVESHRDTLATLDKAQDDLETAQEEMKKAEYQVVKEKTQAFLKYNTLNTKYEQALADSKIKIDELSAKNDKLKDTLEETMAELARHDAENRQLRKRDTTNLLASLTYVKKPATEDEYRKPLENNPFSQIMAEFREMQRNNMFATVPNEPIVRPRRNPPTVTNNLRDERSGPLSFNQNDDEHWSVTLSNRTAEIIQNAGVRYNAIYLGKSGGLVTRWPLKTPQKPLDHKMADGEIVCLAQTEAKDKLIIATADNNIRIHLILDGHDYGSLLEMIKNAHNKRITSICPSNKNQNSFWTCSHDSYVRKFEYTYANTSIDWRNPKGHANNKMLQGKNDEMVYILDSSNTIYNLKVRGKSVEIFMKYDSLPGLSNLTLNDDNSKLLVCNQNPGQLWEIDIKKKQAIEQSRKFDFMRYCQSIAITPDEKWLFCGDQSGHIVIFDLHNNKKHDVWKSFLKSSIDNIFIMKGAKFYWIIASSFERKTSKDSSLRLAFFKPNGSDKQIKEDMFEREARIISVSN